MTRTIKITALALMGVVIFWACGGGNVDPKATGEAFLKAYIQQDFSGAKSYGTKATQDALDAMAGLATGKKEKGDVSKLAVGVFVESGETGTLSYKYDGKDQTLKMKKDGTSWYVNMTKDELSGITGGGSPMNELGNEMGKALENLGEGMKDAVEGVKEGMEGTEDGGEEDHSGHDH